MQLTTSEKNKTSYVCVEIEDYSVRYFECYTAELLGRVGLIPTL